MAFFALIPRWAWATLAVAVLCAGLWFHGLMAGRHQVQAKFDTFVAQTKAAGDAQEQRTKETNARNLAAKEKSDADTKLKLAALNTTIAGLRNKRPSSSFVPSAPADSKRPDLACYDRTEYQRTTGSFIEGLRGLADEGSKSTVELDAARGWAQSPH